MPFSGKDDVQIKNIQSGTYKMKPEKWNNISSSAKSFVRSLLEVDPCMRLTAEQALDHPFIAQLGAPTPKAMQPCCEALKQFGQASKFRRCCMEMLAWSLSNEDGAKVRDVFCRLDEDNKGTISLGELKHALVEKYHLADEHEIVKIFEALDYNHDHEIHYSDFLAAMALTRIDVNSSVLNDTFRRFDADNSGFITVENLRQVLGSNVEGEKVEAFMKEADQNNDGQLSFQEFSEFMRGTHHDHEWSDTSSSVHSGLSDETSVDAWEGSAHKMRPPVAGLPKRNSMLRRTMAKLKPNLHCFQRTKNSRESTTVFPVLAAAACA